MSIMDMDALAAAFRAHKEGQTKFTRRMAIILADMDGTTPKHLVQRCERLGLLKQGSWDWFQSNGGITAEQINQVRRETAQAAAITDASRATPAQSEREAGRG